MPKNDGLMQPTDAPMFPPEVVAVLGDIYSVSTPKQGATSQVWFVECAAGSRVVKCASHAPYVDWLVHEGSVLRALHAAAAGSSSRLPIPAVYFDGGTQGEGLIPYLVMSRLPGEPLAAVMAGETDRQQRLNWMAIFGRGVRQIHDTPAPSALRRERRWLDERLDTAAGYIEAGFELDADDPPRLLERLCAERPAPGAPSLIHGDCMWDNVLVADGTISGMVDWGGGAYGDPRYDLALAILPQEDGELADEEVAAFFAGYGREPLTESEYLYFTNLYGFF